jgi:hypothetical protein
MNKKKLLVILMGSDVGSANQPGDKKKISFGECVDEANSHQIR